MNDVLKSKTVLFGSLLTALGMIEQFMPFLPIQYVGAVGAATGVATIILRFLTKAPVVERRSAPRDDPSVRPV